MQQAETKRQKELDSLNSAMQARQLGVRMLNLQAIRPSFRPAAPVPAFWARRNPLLRIL